MKIKTIGASILKPSIVISIFLIGSYSSLWLKEYSNLSEKSLMALIILSAIFSILLPNLNKMKSVSLLKGELVLQEIKETEASIKELATLTLEVIEAAREDALLMTPEENYKRPFDAASEKLKLLINK